MPNGLARGPDGLIYVPSAISGEIRIFALNERKTIDQIDSFQTPSPIDNLSFDKHGDLFTASIPQLHKWLAASRSPFEIKAPSTVFRIRKRGTWKGAEVKRGSVHEKGKGFEIKKIMEDDGTTLPGATVVVHDAETGRIFLGGAVSPFISICETR